MWLDSTSIEISNEKKTKFERNNSSGHDKENIVIIYLLFYSECHNLLSNIAETS